MKKGLIVLQTEKQCTEEELDEVKGVMAPLLNQYEIAMLFGRDAIATASGKAIEAKHKQAINLMNRYFSQAG